VTTVISSCLSTLDSTTVFDKTQSQRRQLYVTSAGNSEHILVFKGFVDEFPQVAIAWRDVKVTVSSIMRAMQKFLRLFSDHTSDSPSSMHFTLRHILVGSDVRTRLKQLT